MGGLPPQTLSFCHAARPVTMQDHRPVAILLHGRRHWVGGGRGRKAALRNEVNS